MNKICVECGKEFNAIASAITCGIKCSTLRRCHKSAELRTIPEVRLKEKLRQSSAAYKAQKHRHYLEIMADPVRREQELRRRRSPEKRAKARLIMRRPKNRLNAKLRRATVENKIRVAECRRRLRQSNIELARARDKEYYTKYYSDPAKRRRMLDHDAEWRKTHKGKAAARKAHVKRRAAIMCAIIEDVDYVQVHRRTGGNCGICGMPIDLSIKYPHTHSLSYDHVMPLSKGGAHTTANIQLAHFSCNSRKCAKVIKPKNYAGGI